LRGRAEGKGKSQWQKTGGQPRQLAPKCREEKGDQYTVKKNTKSEGEKIMDASSRRNGTISVKWGGAKAGRGHARVGSQTNSGEGQIHRFEI